MLVLLLWLSTLFPFMFEGLVDVITGVSSLSRASTVIIHN